MTVAAERSFTKAAAALGISQPAVSQNISELEKDLDVKLFDRLRGEVALTPQGIVFQEHAMRILSSYEDMNVVFSNPYINNRTAAVRIFISPPVRPLLEASLVEHVHIISPSLEIEFPESEEDADVSILADIYKKDADLNLKVNVLSDEHLLQSFFRQVVNRCLSEACEPTV